MKVIYGTLPVLGNKYLCSGLKGDAFLDDSFQGGKRVISKVWISQGEAWSSAASRAVTLDLERQHLER